MVGLILLAEARSAGLAVAARGDRLVIRGPRRAKATARRLIAHKADVMMALTGRGAGTPGYAPPPSIRGTVRLHPDCDRPGESANDRPNDSWRWQVACLPHDRWVAWRRRATEILAASTATPTAEQITLADRLAYVELDPALAESLTPREAS